jgi:hypothetical protein
MKCQTVIAGIGGQGVLFAAKILTEIARRREVPVLGSQTFGMAQHRQGRKPRRQVPQCSMTRQRSSSPACRPWRACPCCSTNSRPPRAA